MVGSYGRGGLLCLMPPPCPNRPRACCVWLHQCWLPSLAGSHAVAMGYRYLPLKRNWQRNTTSAGKQHLGINCQRKLCSNNNNNNDKIKNNGRCMQGKQEGPILGWRWAGSDWGESEMGYYTRQVHRFAALFRGCLLLWHETLFKLHSHQRNGIVNW